VPIISGSGGGFSGGTVANAITAPDFAASGLTGAVAASRYVGATASGAPASGTFAVGDFVVDQTGSLWVCTAAGTPGTWIQPGGTTLGRTALVYRYTVSGAAKASIDTGVDTPQAGSNDWTGGDVLEVWLTARTDQATPNPLIDMTLNNDSGANYDKQQVSGVSTTASAAAAVGATKWQFFGHGASGSASYAAVTRISFPDYAGTTFNKTGEAVTGQPDATAANQVAQASSLGYRSTSAITRLAVVPDVASNFVVGTQLLIYKRLAS